MHRLSVTVLAGMFLGGCATEYGFRPAAGAGTPVSGFPAASYGVPPDNPDGQVFVAVPEVRQMENGEGQLVHVRLALSNDRGALPWTFDSGRQMAVFPGHAPQRPDYADSDGTAGALLTLNRGDRRIVDLFYRLPAGMTVNKSVPWFQLDWEVAVGSRIVAMQTPFDRQAIDDSDVGDDGYGPYAAADVGIGIGMPWWWYGWWGPWALGWGWGWGWHGNYWHGGYWHGGGPYRGYYGVRGGSPGGGRGGTPHFGGGARGGGRH